MNLWNATNIANRKLAKMYRVTEDLWDLWESPYNGAAAPHRFAPVPAPVDPTPVKI